MGGRSIVFEKIEGFEVCLGSVSFYFSVSVLRCSIFRIVTSLSDRNVKATMEDINLFAMVAQKMEWIQ